MLISRWLQFILRAGGPWCFSLYTCLYVHNIQTCVYVHNNPTCVKNVNYSFFVYVVLKLPSSSHFYRIFVKWTLCVFLVILFVLDISKASLHLPVSKTYDSRKMFWYKLLNSLQNTLIFPGSLLLPFGLPALLSLSSSVGETGLSEFIGVYLFVY